ncbi:MAG: alanine racemase [Actinomycetota bacterium]|nr:alanine racemase [Actinomycetota bacterium]
MAHDPWAPGPPADVVKERLAAVRRRIADAGGDPAKIRVVAVTKGFGPDAVYAAVAAGITDIGENYASELRAKAAALAAGAGGAGAALAAGAGGAGAALAAGAGGAGAALAAGVEEPQGSEVRWHYLGAVQRRSVPRIAAEVAMWHGVCRVEEGAAIAATTPGVPVLVQLELTGLPGRRGVRPDGAPAVVSGLRQAGVQPVGVMAIGVPGDSNATRRVFEAAAATARRCDLPELSIGMSDDLEVAVAAGSTMVRVGRGLFGDRLPRRAPAGSPAQ